MRAINIGCVLAILLIAGASQGAGQQDRWTVSARLAPTWNASAWTVEIAWRADGVPGATGKEFPVGNATVLAGSACFAGALNCIDLAGRTITFLPHEVITNKFYWVVSPFVQGCGLFGQVGFVGPGKAATGAPGAYEVQMLSTIQCATTRVAEGLSYDGAASFPGAAQVPCLQSRGSGCLAAPAPLVNPCNGAGQELCRDIEDAG